MLIKRKFIKLILLLVACLFLLQLGVFTLPGLLRRHTTHIKSSINLKIEVSNSVLANTQARNEGKLANRDSSFCLEDHATVKIGEIYEPTVEKSGYTIKKDGVEFLLPLRSAEFNATAKSLFESEQKRQKKEAKQTLAIIAKSKSSNMCQKMKSQVFTLPTLKTSFHHLGSYNVEQAFHPQRDITFVTQLSSNRVEMMLAIMEHWKGPISLSVYGTSAEIELFIQKVRNQYELFPFCKQFISLNTVIQPSDESALYPVNYLRNIALNTSLTDYVFLCDGDFIPSYGLYNYLLKSVEVLLKPKEQGALVVPAFEEKIKMKSFPLTKTELLRLFKNETVTQFHGAKFPRGHGATNYTKWFQTSSPYGINWKYDYEPYVVARKDGLPKYDESFIGYGFNKLTFIAELHAMKYKFIVIPNEFVIHRIHLPTRDSMLIDEKGKVRNCIKHKYRVFMAEYLSSKYGGAWKKFKRIYSDDADKTIVK